MKVQKFVLFLIIFLRKFAKIDGALEAVNKYSNNVEELSNEEINAALSSLSLSDLESLRKLIDMYAEISDNTDGQSSNDFERLTMDYDDTLGENIDANPQFLGDLEFGETDLPNSPVYPKQHYNMEEYLKQLQDSFPRDKNDDILSNGDNVEQPHIRVKRN